MAREVATTVDSNERGLYILEGLALILFGLAAMVWPGLTIGAFTVIFGLFAVVAGIAVAITGLLKLAEGWSSVGKMIIGLGLVAVGAYALNNPGIAATTLVLLVGFTFLIRGVLDIVVEIMEESDHRVLSIFAGALAIIVGLVLLRYPIEGGLAYVWVLGVYGVIAGLVTLAIGIGRRVTAAR
jgi:uncharacterized membrane protein HdeD (DUF308 family)